MTQILIFILVLMLLVAVVYDIKFHLVPNWLTLPAFIIALLLSLIGFGWSGFTNHLLGAVITGGVWFIFWQSGIMGGGDQKLMMAVGALLGKEPAIAIIFFTALLGGVQALVWIAVRHLRGQSSDNTLLWKKTRLPYSVAIAAGTVIALSLALANRLPAWLAWPL